MISRNQVRRTSWARSCRPAMISITINVSTSSVRSAKSEMSKEHWSRQKRYRDNKRKSRKLCRPEEIKRETLEWIARMVFYDPVVITSAINLAVCKQVSKTTLPSAINRNNLVYQVSNKTLNLASAPRAEWEVHRGWMSVGRPRGTLVWTFEEMKTNRLEIQEQPSIWRNLTCCKIVKLLRRAVHQLLELARWLHC